MKPQTFGELKASGYAPRGVKEELRENLRRALSRGENPFPGIHGYERTVLPALYNAILSKHDFLLLGLRGQAKTRLLRMLVHLLDAEIPAIAGSELSEDPVRADHASTAGASSPRRATRRRSPGSRARSATARSSRRPT